MTWTVTAYQDDETFFDDHIRLVIASDSKPLPAQEQEIGDVAVHWEDVGGKQAYVQAQGGSPDDRLLAMSIVLAQLQPHGYRQASWSFDDAFRKTADWSDLMSKAKRLIQSGNVQILRNGYNNIVAKVRGDHGTYDSEIFRQDPNSRAITGSDCSCSWGEYQNQPRTRQWKKFQDRPCAHILAAYWSALSAPLDEDAHPANPAGGGPQDPQTQQPTEGFGAPAGSPAAPVAPSFGPEQSQGLSGPGIPQGGGGAPGQAGPSPADVLPQFPMANQPQVNPASIPGLKGPTPTDPIQYPAGPGSTFSSWKFAWNPANEDDEDTTTPTPQGNFGWNNSDLVQLRYPDTAEYVGRPESGLAGTQMDLTPGTVGEIRGTDPVTGMVNVLWTGKDFDQMGKLQPFGASGWHFRHYLIPRGDLKKPGPAIRRRR